MSFRESEKYQIKRVIWILPEKFKLKFWIGMKVLRPNMNQESWLLKEAMARLITTHHMMKRKKEFSNCLIKLCIYRDRQGKKGIWKRLNIEFHLIKSKNCRKRDLDHKFCRHLVFLKRLIQSIQATNKNCILELSLMNL